VGYLYRKSATNPLTKQQTSGNLSVRLVVCAHWSKGCPVHPGIIQRVFQKVAYVRWSHVRPVVWFAERMSGGPSAYVHATDISVRPPDLAYVCHLRVSFQLSFLRVQGTLRLTLRVLGFRLSGYTKGSG
jgi:hypothetical protein